MFKIIYRSVKQDPAKEFFPETFEFRQSLVDAKQVGELISEIMQVDNLVHRHELIWKDVSSFRNFSSLPTISVYIKEKTQYNSKNNIDHNIIVYEYDE
jgi:hypothetical protein